MRVVLGADAAIEVALRQRQAALVSSNEVYGEAFLLARTVRRLAYDMFYLALARREDATFLTTDSALKRDAKRQGIRVA